jgi:hypothetical protein
VDDGRAVAFALQRIVDAGLGHVIQGRNDTYLTVEEFAAMIGRSPRTVQNWASKGQLKFRYIFGVPLISLRAIENIIEQEAPPNARDGRLAVRLMGSR